MHMQPEQQRYLRLETSVSMGVNALLSMVATWIVFGGATMVAWSSGDKNLLADAMPHAFAVAAMGTLVPTYLTRRRLRTAKVPHDPHLPAITWLPSFLWLRALVIAVEMGALGYALHRYILMPFVPAHWPMAQVYAFKALYGALISLPATSIAVRAALGDRLPV